MLARFVQNGVKSIPNTVISIPWTSRRLLSAVVARDTVKPLDSRKTYLIDKYTRIVRTTPIVLVLHYGGFLRTENDVIRRQIIDAGGRLMITKSRIFKVALRGLNHPDPASKEAHELYSRTKSSFGEFFNGSTAIITIPEINPVTVKKIVKVLDGLGDRLILLGAQIDGEIRTRDEIDAFKALPSLDELRADLAGVISFLGGAGLVQTLEAGSKLLYLTMEARQKQMKEGQKE